VSKYYGLVLACPLKGGVHVWKSRDGSVYWTYGKFVSIQGVKALELFDKKIGNSWLTFATN